MILLADVSNNQHTVPIGALARDVAGVYHKATQGLGFVDLYAHERRMAARVAGLPFGLYHFAGWQDGSGVARFGTPHEEAEHFLTQRPVLHRTDLRPVLDLELGHPSAWLGRWARAWCNVIENAIGVAPILYSYGSFVEGLELDRPIGNGLWDAGYGRNDGRDYGITPPRPWKHVLLHQFTSVGVLRGVPVRVDLSHGRRLPFAHPVRAHVPGGGAGVRLA